ncbi:uncharacterized protein LOC132302600 [Cornus florida]|uniref:uncharacterized protein LOC132302600 n=1 Tax=Cornus florida TaxID=4283 RepID=UPI00289C1543|nr:uncharacterized protein LOC132302600 [Cornus florida]
MVILGKDRDGVAEKLTAMGPERSKPLHNFSMPCLKWGNQRFLRCVKVNSNGDVSAVDRRSSAPAVDNGVIGWRRESESEKRGSIIRTESFKKSPSPAANVGGSGRKSEAESGGDDGIEAIRTKLMFDLQTAADKMKVAILREGLEDEPPAAAAAARPWNLRTRRAASNGMGGGGGKSLKVDDRRPNFSPLRTENRSPRSRGVAAPTTEKEERPKFSVSLSRREIEHDFREMVGHRPPRRPKKRAKIVQNQVDSLFPGLWLTEITADCYKVPDAPESGKK